MSSTRNVRQAFFYILQYVRCEQFVVADFEHLVHAYIPVAPVGTEKYTIQQYQSVKVPTFVVYGKNLNLQSMFCLQFI